jgi:hypothetical protein
MCKKVLIAAAAVLVGLVVVRGTWLGSHLRLTANKARHWVERSVPPEQEIERLKMEVQNLKRDDEKHVDKVARLAVEVEKMQRDVASVKTNLSREEARLREIRGQMGESSFVVFQGQRYTRDDLRNDALSFKTAEDAVKSKEAALEARQRILTLEKKKLGELQNVRNQMTADLERLEAALVEERSAQAANESCVDDSHYRQLRKDMEGVRERIEILKKKRELRGEMHLPQVSDQQKKQDAEADRFLEARFGAGEKKQVADSK